MRATLSLFFMAVVGLCAGQAYNGSSPYPPPMPFPFPQAPMSGGIPIQIQQIQAQQMMSRTYGNLILNFQAAQGWMQVAQGWLAMHSMENGGNPMMHMEEQNNLEESADLEEAANLEEEASDLDLEETPKLDNKYTQLERSTEMALLHVIKIMYLTAGNKFTAAQQRNYQTKIQLAMLQSAGASNGPMAWILYMMYYMEALRVTGTAITIQRQDAWNTWTLHEIMETDEFGNSLDKSPPDSFLATLLHSRAIAMQLYYTEASIDFQIMILEYYMQTMMMYMGGQYPHANSAAASFMEVEESAEPADPAQPNKPFMPFMMGMGGMMSPMYMSYMAYYIKWFGTILNFQAAQGLHMDANLALHPDAKASKYAGHIRQNAVYALQQWAYLKYMEAMLQIWGAFSGQPVPAAAAASNAAASSLIQTEEPVAQQSTQA